MDHVLKKYFVALTCLSILPGYGQTLPSAGESSADKSREQTEVVMPTASGVQETREEEKQTGTTTKEVGAPAPLPTPFLIPPRPESHVYDELDILTEEDESELRKSLVNLSREHSAEIFVATMPFHTEQEASNAVSTLNNKWGRHPFRITILATPSGNTYVAHTALPKEYIKGAPMQQLVVGVWLEGKRVEDIRSRILFLTEQYSYLLQSLSARSNVFKEEQLNEQLAHLDSRKKLKVIRWVIAIGSFFVLLFLVYLFFLIRHYCKPLAFPEVYPRERLGGSNSGGTVHTYPVVK